MPADQTGDPARPCFSDGLFDAFMLSCQNAILAIAADHTLLFANRIAEDWLFSGQAPRCGHPWNESIDPTLASLIAGMMSSLDNGAGRPKTELHPIGSLAQAVQLSGFQLRDAHGTLYGYGFIGEDVSHHKRFELALEQERNHFLQALEMAPLALLMTDAEGRIVLTNRNLETLFGYPREELIGQPVDILLPEAMRAHHQQLQAKFLQCPSPRHLGKSREFHGLKRNGEKICIEIGLAPFQTSKGLFIVVTILDIGERASQMAAMHERELRYRSVIESVPDGFLIIRRNGEILMANHAYARMSGYTRAELLQTGFVPLDAEDSDLMLAEHIRNVLRQGYDRFETQHRRKDGSLWPAELTVSLIPALDELFVFIRDLTEIRALEEERRKAEQRIQTMAWHDQLTQLPNRWLLIDRLRQALSSARRNSTHGALLFIDVDHFKWLNDSLGHEMGDLLLIQIARRLLDNIRAEDTAARFGGDEFVIMLTSLAQNPAEAIHQSEMTGYKLLRALNIPYQLRNHLYRCTPSIGITLFREEEDIDAIFRRADRAMYKVKNSGRNAVHMHESNV